MNTVPVAGDRPYDPPPLPSGCCPLHGTRAHVAITGRVEDALRWPVSAPVAREVRELRARLHGEAEGNAKAHAGEA